MRKRVLCVLVAAVLLLSCVPMRGYAVDVLDTYLAENITQDMTLRQKLEVICEFVAGYDYSPYVSTAEQMLSTGGGDSYAGSEILLRFCEKLGISAALRPSDRDGNGTQVNVLVEADGIWYQLETGFQEIAPRPYEITQRSSLLSYRFADGGIEVYQYDGAPGKALTVPQSIDGHTVVAVGERFLSSCAAVEEVILPDTVKSIGADAFNGCGNLNALQIPKAVTHIGERAFAGCDKLKNLTSASESFTVSDFVLYNADMTRVEAAPYCRTAILPQGVAEIAPYAFHCSKNLKSVVIPESVRGIGEGAFADCEGLEWITFQGVEPEMADFLFFAVTADAYAAWESRIDTFGNITWNSYTPTADYAAEYDGDANVTKLHVRVWGEGTVRIPMKVTKLELDITLERPEAVLDAVLETPSEGYVFLKQGPDGAYSVLPQTGVTEKGIRLRIEESCRLMICDKSLSFPDVAQDNWAKSSVDYLTARGLMTGNLDGTFGLTDSIQRRTVAMMLWRLAGSPQVEGKSPFPDVTGGRYLMPVLWAYQNGIITGYTDGTFRPEETISRQHFAVMLHRYAKWTGVELEKQNNGSLTDFSDFDAMNPRMHEAMQWALDHGLINGRSGGMYDPTGGTSRAQMAVILTRYLKQFYQAL